MPEKENFVRKIESRTTQEEEVLESVYRVFKKHLGDIIPDTEIKIDTDGKILIQQKIEISPTTKPISELTGAEISEYKDIAMEQFFELMNVQLPAVREEIAELELEKNIDIDVLYNVRDSRLADNVLVDLKTGKIILAGLFDMKQDQGDKTSPVLQPIKKVLRTLNDVFTRTGILEMMSKGRTRVDIQIPEGEKDIIALTYDDFPSDNVPNLLAVLDTAEKEYRERLEQQLKELEGFANATDNEVDHQKILKEMEFLGKKIDQGLKVTFFMNEGNMKILGEGKTQHLIEEVLQRGHHIANHEIGQFPGEVAGYYSGHGGLAQMQNVLHELKEKYPQYAEQLLPQLVRRSGVHFTKYFEDEKEKLGIVELLANPISLFGMHASETKSELLAKVAKMCTDQGSVLIWHIGKSEDTKIDKEGDFEPKMLQREDVPVGKPYYPDVHVEGTKKFLDWYIKQNGKFAPTTKEYIPGL